MTQPDSDKAPPRVLGWAIGVGVAAMLGGLAGGALALARRDFAGAGLCFLAAGVSAGLLVNAVLRH